MDEKEKQAHDDDSDVIGAQNPQILDQPRQPFSAACFVGVRDGVAGTFLSRAETSVVWPVHRGGRPAGIHDASAGPDCVAAG